MTNFLNFAHASAHVDVPSNLASALLREQSSPLVTQWADNAALLLDTLPSGVVFAIGKLRLSEEASRALAHAIATAVCQALQRRGAPASMEVEIDRPQGSTVRPDRQVRTLLPHHDGGHCSYLTPSLLDDPEWDVRLRVFSNEIGKYTTTPAHKLYQGIFIVNPGEGLSVTTYYDLLRMLRQAYTRTIGQPPASVAQLVSWLGNTIRGSLALPAQHQSRYLAIGAALGSHHLAHHGIAVHYAEADFTVQEIERFPELKHFNSDDTLAPTERFLSQLLIETLGMSWQEFRAQCEICVPSERFDVVFGHNLTLLHGGLMGGPGRLLEPICMVIKHASGADYEDWLAQAWRRREMV
ncbi:MAG TPA: hypothetical protein VFU49_02085 [Ktedonobacteraceae bacterium]|nr:hypothetical protein [Ktedonobacteraceae bacterium]